MTSKGSFAAKKAKKLFKKRQNDEGEGAKQHMAPSTLQAAWTFVRVALSNRSKINGRKDTPNFFISIGVGELGKKGGLQYTVQFQHWTLSLISLAARLPAGTACDGRRIRPS